MPRPAIVVHTLDHAKSALAAAERTKSPILLLSPEGFAAYGGALLFHTMVEQAQIAYPAARCTAMLDCGDAPGHALGALRTGFKAVRLGGRAAARTRVGAIAAKLKATVVAKRPPALDLLDSVSPEEDCMKFLTGLGRLRTVPRGKGRRD
jgi:hypothetical protein